MVANLMNREWLDMVAGEGTVDVSGSASQAELGEDAEPPCPACGTAAALVEGCCSDCGLALA